MAVSVKMGVDINQFKTGMQQAQQAIKTTNAQLKAAAAEYKATGDKEKYMAEQSKLLKTQMSEQEKAVKNAQSAMEAMRKAGVDETSAAYQKLAQQLASAQAAMYQTEAALNGLGAEEQGAAKGANELADNLKSINKKVSFDAVIGGIDKITSALGNAMKKAVSLGESIFNSLMDSAKWADDAQTAAQMYGITVKKYLQMEALFATGTDSSVDAVLGAQARLRKGIGKDSAETMKYMKQLGLVVTEYGGKTAEGFDRMITDDQDELFWKAGQAIMAMGDAFEQEAAAQAIFGKSWRELVPLFDTENGGFANAEEFNEALESMNVNTEDQVKKLAELNDAMATLEHDFDVLKKDILAELAPVLTEVAHALSEVVKSVSDYLKTDEGQAQLKRFADAIAGIVEDITNIDPESVVGTFASVVSGIVNSFEWIYEHWSDVKAALIAIGVGFAAIKLSTVGLSIANVISGFKGLGAASAAGAGAGAAGAGSVLGGMAVVALGAILCAPALAQIIKGELPEAKDAAQIFDNITSKLNGREGNENATTNTVGSILSGDTDAGQLVEDTLKTVGDSLAGRANGNEAVNKGIRSFITGDNSEWGISEDEKWYYQPSELNPNVTNQIANAVNLVLKNLEEGRAFNEGLTDKHDYRYSADYVDMMGELIRQLGQDTAIRVLQNPESWSLMRESYNDLGRINSKTYAQWFVNEVLRRGMDYDPEAEAREAQRKAEEAQAIIQQADEAKKRNTKPSWFPSNWDEMDMMEQFGKKSEWFSGLTPDMLNEIADETIRAKLEQGINDNNVALFEEALTEIANLGKENTDESQALENATVAIESMPEAVSDAVSKTKINLMMPGGLLGWLGNSHANGLFSVPWDGYPAILHKNERVIPASQANNYNSNIYFGNVNLNNGLEIEALTESIDRRNRRQRQGYGS